VANDLHEERESRSRRCKPHTTTATKTSAATSNTHHHQQELSAGSKRKTSSSTASNEDDLEERVESPVMVIKDDVIPQEHDEKHSPLVFLCSTLSAEELDEVGKFCERFPPAAVHDTYSEAVTHVIVRVDRKGKGKSQVRILKNRTMKYLQGVLGEQYSR
jgi:hypothetical protein